MRELTPRQRAVLKSLAHSLKPVLHIGKDGVTEALAASLRELFQARELVKVRVLDTAPGAARDLGPELAARVDGAHLVQVIGRTLVLYRRHPEDPEIALPQA